MNLSSILILVFCISGIPLLTSSLSSLGMAIFQAATSIQEQTSMYLIRVSTVLLTLAIGWKWAWNELITLTTGLFSQIVTAGSLR